MKFVRADSYAASGLSLFIRSLAAPAALQYASFDALKVRCANACGVIGVMGHVRVARCADEKARANAGL